MYQMSH